MDGEPTEEVAPIDGADLAPTAESAPMDGEPTEGEGTPMDGADAVPIAQRQYNLRQRFPQPTRSSTPWTRPTTVNRISPNAAPTGGLS
jgi:hypothetical protein